MPFPARVQYLTLMLLSKLLSCREPCYLACRFAFKSPSQFSLKCTNKLDLRVEFCATDTFRNAFMVYAARLWNKLPLETREKYHKPCFKTALRKLLEQQSIAVN
ncbi:hypothetical protein P5V15_002627 [Pogonomyrmex californicus]